MPELTTRPARVFIGWLDEDTGMRLLRARKGNDAEGLRTRLGAARASVAARPACVSDPHVLSALPATHAHLQARGVEVDGTEGTVRLAELGSLRASQPYVFTDRAPHLSTSPTLDELARVTLPEPTDPDVELGFDAKRGTFRVTSASQNLRILGEFAGPIQGAPAGSIGVGFLVAVPASLMRVAVIDGCPVLVDGLHRAAALVASGIGVAPVVVDDDATLEQWWAPGMLDAQTCLGPRPAFVRDLLDDDVAASTALHHVGRAVEIAGRELDLGDPGA